MRSHVHLEVRALRRRKVRALLLAQERPLTHVRSHVRCEAIAPRRRVLTTFLLAERSLARVRSHVRLEVSPRFAA